jgi:hypothetical protein
VKSSGIFKIPLVRASFQLRTTRRLSLVIRYLE